MSNDFSHGLKVGLLIELFCQKLDFFTPNSKNLMELKVQSENETELKVHSQEPFQESTRPNQSDGDLSTSLLSKSGQEPKYTDHSVCAKGFIGLTIFFCVIWIGCLFAAIVLGFNRLARKKQVTSYIAHVLIYLVLIAVNGLSIKKLYDSLKQGLLIDMSNPDLDMTDDAAAPATVKNTSSDVTTGSKFSELKTKVQSLLTDAKSKRIDCRDRAYKDVETSENTKERQMILYLLNAWIISQWAHFLNDLPMSILGNILIGWYTDDFSLYAIAIGYIINDIKNLFIIYIKKCQFNARNCCGCCGPCCNCCCNCITCKCFCMCFYSHFAEHHVVYYENIGEFMIWATTVAYATGVSQMAQAVVSGYEFVDDYNSFSAGVSNFKVFWLCYNFMAGILLMIRSKKDYLVFLYQFAYYWSKDNINYYENIEIQNKMQQYLQSQTGFCFIFSIDRDNDQFARIGQNENVSETFNHKIDCYSIFMYSSMYVTGLFLSVLIIAYTFAFVNLYYPDLFELFD